MPRSMQYILEHSDAKMVIVSDQKLYDLIFPVSQNIKAVKHFFTFDEIEGATNWKEVIERGKKANSDTRDKLDDIKR